MKGKTMVPYKKKNEYDVTIGALNSTLDKYETFFPSLNTKTVFLGFDGYIDSLYSMVSERINSNPHILEKVLLLLTAAYKSG